ncbi:hypothetical protein L0F63_001862, partial [Massospora cicadina]
GNLGKVEPSPIMDILLLVVAMVSLFFNLLLLVVNYKRKVWTEDIILISIIAAGDVLSDGFRILTQVLRQATDEAIVHNDNWWCKSSAVLVRAIGTLVVILTALLGVVRYLAIVRGRKLSALKWG